MKKIPFHYGLFYHAMIGRIGRDPDNAIRRGFDGYYEFWFYPKDELEERTFPGFVNDMTEWLSHFIIDTTGSVCEYTKIPVTDPTDLRQVLIVRVYTEPWRPKTDEEPEPSAMEYDLYCEVKYLVDRLAHYRGLAMQAPGQLEHILKRVPLIRAELEREQKVSEDPDQPVES